jgi:dTDP-L-rhamnose 4-epimerase
MAVPTVVIPVLNEAGALGPLLSSMPPGYAPLVVDNGSTDGSGEIARALGAEVVTEPTRGFGAACFAGLAAARPADGVVCFMDGDASCPPYELPRVAAAVLAGTSDLMLGRRRAGDRRAWPAHARLANAALAWELRRRTGLALRDIGPMRAARRDALLALDLRDRRFGWPLEMVLRAAAAGWRVDEIDVQYLRRVGQSKVTGTLRGTARTVRDMASALR